VRNVVVLEPSLKLRLVPLVVDWLLVLVPNAAGTAGQRREGVPTRRTSAAKPAVSRSLGGQRHYHGGSKREPHVAWMACVVMSMC